MAEKEKVVLAYSGGLDTSCCLKWLQVEKMCIRDSGSTIGKPGKAGPKPGPIAKAIQERCAKMMAGKLDEYAAWIAQVE